MKWIIKNPAPLDKRLTKWGDYHFGRSLAKYLERMGHSVATHYQPKWNTKDDADVVLVLRGKYPYEKPRAKQLWERLSRKRPLRVMWNISHPADVPLEEYATYDIVCVASHPHAEWLTERLDVPVYPLLQCTDPEEFHPEVGDLPKTDDVVFIGNTRGVERPAITWALEDGLPLKIWGRGWKANDVPSEFIVADYFPNEQLGGLYSSSRATLNDHWDDMKQYGFVNNRIFDAIACGLPVVSDWHQELEHVLPKGVLMYRDRAEFKECMDALLTDYPRVKSEVDTVATQVREEFSFQRRAEELVYMVEKARADRGR